MSDRLISARAAAKRLGITREELYDLKCRGVIPAAQVTLRTAMFDPDDVDAYAIQRERAIERKRHILDEAAERLGLQRTYQFSTGETVTILYDE
ncbi:MAG: hypothetical protein SFX73_14050 [Kofleriaceae bacterium]|nr:hypothetical protein [Kofleriaceae bacterium]